MSIKDKEVLIIDDDPSHINLTKKIVENLGCNVSFAYTVDEGIAEFERRQPHLILLDMHLEDELCFDFLEKMRKKIKKLDCKVIIFSGSKNKKLIAKAKAFGAHDYLEKPLNSKVLIERIKKNLMNNIMMRVVFESDPPELRAHAKGDLVKFNEYEFVLMSSIKLAKQTEVVFKSYKMPDVKLHDIRTISSGKNKFKGDGMHENYLSIVGITDEQKNELVLLKKKGR